MSAQPIVTERAVPQRRVLAARLEPFDSYWQAPANIEAGYSSFAAYYRANYLQHLPTDRGARILVISCGPGYLVNVLAQAGWDVERLGGHAGARLRRRQDAWPAIRDRDDDRIEAQRDPARHGGG